MNDDMRLFNVNSIYFIVAVIVSGIPAIILSCYVSVRYWKTNPFRAYLYMVIALLGTSIVLFYTSFCFRSSVYIWRFHVNTGLWIIGFWNVILGGITSLSMIKSDEELKKRTRGLERVLKNGEDDLK